MTNKILITGARGKTGSRLAAILADQGVPTRLASRKADGPGEIFFDWSKPESFAPAFEAISAVYLVAPTDRADHVEVMVPAIETALKLGVRRFVLLSASSLEAGSVMMGGVHSAIRDMASEWCVLRPTWFMQNFSEQQHLPTIRDENTIYTASKQGRVPFIDAHDIASAAAGALTAEKAANTDLILTGPELLNYDGVAERLSQRLNRPIRHNAMSHEDFMARLTGAGFDEAYAKALADMDAAIAGGSEDRLTDGVEQLTGKKARYFNDFVDQNIAAWS